MLRKLKEKWLILSGLAVVLGVVLVALGAYASTESQSETMAMSKANPCNPCAAKAKMNPCNPCAAKNPCNPCGMKKAANPCNPCGGTSVDAELFTRPAGTRLYAGNQAQLVAEGKRLWEDKSLGTSGLACVNCHINTGNFKETFLKPYPHYVAMPAAQAGVKQVSADEMVQFCMIVPMAGKPLAWDSRKLAALAAYTEAMQTQFKAAVAANPCLIKSPAANPCNPCAAKNPCNPCGAKNPCNPCGAKNPCGR